LNDSGVAFAKIDAVARFALARAQKQIGLGKERAERIELSARSAGDDLEAAITADEPGDPAR